MKWASGSIVARARVQGDVFTPESVKMASEYMAQHGASLTGGS